MSGIRDTATVTLNVNGVQAKQMMSDLEAKIKQTEAQITSLKANMADPRDVEKARKQLKIYQKQLDEMKSATEGVNNALGNLDTATPRQLERALRTLNKQLKDMVPGSEAWNSHIEKIKELKERLSEIKAEASEPNSVWERFSTWSVSAWPAFDLLQQWGGGLFDAMRGIVDAYADIDQEMANVRKFTGMTDAEVRDLNEAFKQIDTRSTREQLNSLAQEAGRLGMQSKEDVLGFVSAADKINVALDDLGEGATLTLSKLTDIFGDKELFGVEQSLLKTGSVINELSQSSSASAPYIAEFAQRLSGVGVQAGMTASQIMALGAVLDSSGQQVEAASTAVSQIIVRLMQDPAKYARVAGLEVESFSKLLRKDANEALLTLLETLRNAGGLEVLAPMFKDMGENGSQAIQTLTSLAKNIDVVRQRQNEANIAFEEGTSIDKEFIVQNTTVQAELAKAKKRFQELRIEIGEKLSPLTGHLLNSASALMNAVSRLTEFVWENRVAIISLIAIISSYSVATGVAKAVTFAWSAVTKTLIALQNGFRIAVALSKVAIIAFTGGLNKARHAFQLLNIAIKANPLGLLVSALAAVLSLIKMLSPSTDEFTKKMKESIGIASSYNGQLEKELTELDKLFGALEGAQEGTDEYRKAKEKIISLYGSYLGGLVSEEGKILDVEKAYLRLAEAIRISNTERGIQEARDAVDSTYVERMTDLQKQLSVSLVAYGASEREAARLAVQVSTAMSSNRTLSQETVDRLAELSKNSPKEGLDEGFLTGILADLAPGSQNSYIGDFFGVDQILQPAELVNQMFKAKDNRQVALEEINAIQRQQRPLGEINAEILQSMEQYAKAASVSGGMVLKVSDALAGTVEMVEVSSDEASQILNQVQGEIAYRKKGPTPISRDTVDVPSGYDSSSVPDNTSGPFASEANWREHEETLARLSYAKGENDYEQYTKRMDQIAADYYSKLKERTDLSYTERLRIEAQYQEALNQITANESKFRIDEENASYAETVALLKNNYAGSLENERLSANERLSIESNYQEALEQAELQHLQNLVKITGENTPERLKAEQDYLEARLVAAKRHQQKYEQDKAEHEKRLASVKNDVFGMNQSEKDDAYKESLAILSEVYNAELLAAGDNAEEKLRIEEAFQQGRLALMEQYNQEGAENTQNAYMRAVNGFGEWLQGEGGQALMGTLNFLSSNISAMFSGISSIVQAELQLQTAAIEKRYDKEIQYAQGNSYKVARLEKKKERDIAKVKNAANKKMFAMQVIQTIAQTAQAGLNAYSSTLAIPIVGPALAPAAMALAIATGAIQIAAMKKQQQAAEAQGYSKGGFTKPGGVDEPAGIVHAGEWVASQKLLANPVARPMIEALDYAQRTNTIGSLREEDVSRSIRANDSLSRFAEGDNSTALIVGAVAHNAKVLNALTTRLNEPFVTVNTVTGDHGIKSAQDEYSRLLRNKSPKMKRNGTNY